MGHPPKGDVREAPKSERSFLSGETEHVFATTNRITRIVFYHGFEDASYRMALDNRKNVFAYSLSLYVQSIALTGEMIWQK